jgi:hypothetical protein
LQTPKVRESTMSGVEVKGESGRGRSMKGTHA